MSDLKIKRMSMRNWMTVKSAEITFPEKGLVLVQGSNLASNGKLESNGSGKSGIAEALCRALTGVAGRYANLGHYAPDLGKGGTLITVECELRGNPLTVEMGYKAPELSKTGEGLKFTYDGKVFNRGNVDHTRQELSKTIRVTPELAEWTVLLDGDKLKFNRMSQQDSVNLLMTALNQPPWTEYYERVTKTLQDSRRQVAVCSQALDSSKSRMTRMEEDVEIARNSYAAAVKERDRQADELQDRIDGLRKLNSGDTASVAAAEKTLAANKKQLTLLAEQQAVYNHQMEIKRQTLRDEYAIKNKDVKSSLSERATCASSRDQATRALNTLLAAPKFCPTCRKPMDKVHSDEEIAKARLAVTEAGAAFTSADQAYRKAEAVVSAIQNKIGVIEEDMQNQGCMNDVRELNRAVTENDRIIRNLGATIQQRELQIVTLGNGVDNSIVNKRAAVVEERERSLASGQEAIDKAARDLAEEEQLFAVIEYWHKAFGPAGIPNMVLADAIAPLNRVAQRISSLMTGGTLNVSYSTQRELAKGDSKAQLVVKVDNKIGSKRMEGNSKGESCLTNLIIAENISEIGQVSERIGFRFYDEISSGLDAMVRRSVFSYLRDLANRLGILVFIVDHHAESASYCDHVLMATKDKNGTTYAWKAAKQSA